MKVIQYILYSLLVGSAFIDADSKPMNRKTRNLQSGFYTYDKMLSAIFHGYMPGGCALLIPKKHFDAFGTFDTQLNEEFWLGFTRQVNCTLHIKKLAGKNSHHIIEGIFKSVARSLRAALSIDEKNKNRIPSTKGTL